MGIKQKIQKINTDRDNENPLREKKKKNQLTGSLCITTFLCPENFFFASFWYFLYQVQKQHKTEKAQKQVDKGKKWKFQGGFIVRLWCNQFYLGKKKNHSKKAKKQKQRKLLSLIVHFVCVGNMKMEAWPLNKSVIIASNPKPHLYIASREFLFIIKRKNN